MTDTTDRCPVCGDPDCDREVEHLTGREQALGRVRVALNYMSQARAWLTFKTPAFETVPAAKRRLTEDHWHRIIWQCDEAERYIRLVRSIAREMADVHRVQQSLIDEATPEAIPALLAWDVESFKRPPLDRTED